MARNGNVQSEKKEKIHWEIEEMEADHITPWCEGGKTEILQRTY